MNVSPRDTVLTMKFHISKRQGAGIGVVICLIALLLMILFLARGLIREAVPSLVAKKYTKSLNASYDAANTELNFPLYTFGIKPEFIDSAGCSLNYADGFNLEVGCGRSVSGETSVLTFEDINLLSKDAKDLDNRLKKYNWQGSFREGGDGPNSVESLLGSRPSMEYGVMHETVDYWKTVGGNDCLLRLSLFAERDMQTGSIFGVLSCDPHRIDIGTLTVS